MSTFTKILFMNQEALQIYFGKFSKPRAVKPIKDIKARLPYPNYFPY